MSEYVAYQYHQEVYTVPLVFDTNGTLVDNFYNRLNELGELGWDMVSVIQNTHKMNIGIDVVHQPVYTAYFKRPYIKMLEETNE